MSLRGIAIETLKLPPFAPLARQIYGRFFKSQRKGTRYHGVFASHIDALRAVPLVLRSSYDNEDAAAQYRERTKQLTISDYPVSIGCRGCSTGASAGSSIWAATLASRTTPSIGTGRFPPRCAGP